MDGRDGPLRDIDAVNVRHMMLPKVEKDREWSMATLEFFSGIPAPLGFAASLVAIMITEGAWEPRFSLAVGYKFGRPC